MLPCHKMSINFGTETAQSLLNHRYLRGLKIKKAIIDNKIRAVEQILVPYLVK